MPGRLAPQERTRHRTRPASDEQRMWIERRADTQRHRDHARDTGHDTAELDELNGELNTEITRSGMRGHVLPPGHARRHRSTRRRQDTPDPPRRPLPPRTIGQTHTTASGKTFRPPMFITRPAGTSGKLTSMGVPPDPVTTTD